MHDRHLLSHGKLSSASGRETNTICRAECVLCRADMRLFGAPEVVKYNSTRRGP